MPKSFPQHTNVTICPHCQRQQLEFPPIDRLVSIHAAAEFFNVHPSTVRNWIDSGFIRVFKITEDSKIMRVPLSDFLRLGDRFGSKNPITRLRYDEGLKLKRGHAPKEKPVSDPQTTENK